MPRCSRSRGPKRRSGSICWPAKSPGLAGWAVADGQSPDLLATALPRYLNGRAATIYAGSNEIQRDLIARAVLG